MGAKKRMLPPEVLAARENVDVVLSFRISSRELAELRLVAERAGMGHASMCRRIIQEYLRLYGPNAEGGPADG